jgi:thiol:disulfide interchange protein DsbD
LDASSQVEGGQWVGGALLAWMGGLLTSLTPCVYPLIPITLGVFGAGANRSRGHAVALTFSYVLGIAVVFSALGVLAAKTGQAFGALLGSPVVAVGLALFLAALAASMFGAYELRLPARWAARMSQVGGNGLGGAFLMGGVSGFLAAPCTGPVLTGLLAFVAKSQNTAMGAGLLFVYALGVGFPFMLMGIFALRLPRSGPWMEWVKGLLGILLLALAVGYLRDGWPALRELLSRTSGMLGPSAPYVLGAVAALTVWAGALSRHSAGGWVAAGLLVLALAGRQASLDVPRPAASVAGEFTWQYKIPQSVSSEQSFDQILQNARSLNKPVLIDFFAEWCAACKELDREVYPVPSVRAETERFVTIKVDSTHEEEAALALIQRFGVQGLPTVAFISSDGKVLQSPRILGFLSPDGFIAELQKVR